MRNTSSLLAVSSNTEWSFPTTSCSMFVGFMIFFLSSFLCCQLAYREQLVLFSKDKHWLVEFLQRASYRGQDKHGLSGR